VEATDPFEQNESSNAFFDFSFHPLHEQRVLGASLQRSHQPAASRCDQRVGRCRGELRCPYARSCAALTFTVFYAERRVCHQRCGWWRHVRAMVALGNSRPEAHLEALRLVHGSDMRGKLHWSGL
jgi:hypothetical protein